MTINKAIEMHRFFYDAPNRGRVASTKFHIVEIKYNTSYPKLFKFYTDFPQYVKPENLLVRIANDIPVELFANDDSIYAKYSNDSDRSDLRYGITNNNNAGRLHRNFLYTDNCAVVSVNFEPLSAIKNWKDIRPVRVLTHPHRTTEYVLANVMLSSKNEDYSVVGIDMGLFAVAFNNWARERIEVYNEAPDLQHFVTTFILPRMFPEQIQISCRNLLLEAAGEERLGELKIVATLHSQKFKQDVVDTYKDVISDLNKSRSRTLMEITASIPFPKGLNYYSVVPTVNTVRMDQSYWTNVLIYTDWLYCLIRPIDNFDQMQDDVIRKAMLIHRYVKVVNPSKHIKNSAVYEEWRRKYNYVMDKFIQQTL